MRTIITTFLFLILSTGIASADDKLTVKKYLQEKLDSTTVVLRDKEITSDLKKEKILGIISPAFDFTRMAKNTLGKKYWPTLNKNQKTNFVTQFTVLLKKICLESLLSFSSATIQIEEPYFVKKKIYIPTFIITADGKITMIYKFYKSRNGWKIYNIEIDGVSIIRTYRTQFYEFLKKGTIDDLITKLMKTHPKDKPQNEK